VKTRVRLLALAIALAGCSAGTDAANHATGNEAQAATSTRSLPALTGRVVDMANLLSPAEEAALTGRLAALERQTSDQLVIVTTPSLEGETIAAYGMRLGNGWRIGQRGRNNGVLLIVAPAESQTRIEVGRGLEATLTNESAAEIIRRDLIPHFRAGRWHAGIDAGTGAIIAVLTETAAKRGQ
jgi:uncharacterized protein